MLESFKSEIKPLPLNRVAVKDGLLLTADLWEQAHNYHRQKQNLFYQSFHTPGIVAGLGVSVIEAPREISAQYRDFRWLRIQPGVAVDAMGNAIIVPTPIDFRIASALKKEPFTVYLVISYVAPEELEGNAEQEIITETFRIDEKINPPQGLEVELCRILFQASSVQLAKQSLTNAIDIFNPEPNSLDLRYRRQAGIRAQKTIRIGQIINGNSRVDQVANNFSSLLRSLRGLYPQMEGDSQIMTIDLKPDYPQETDFSQQISQENIAIIYLDYQQAQNLSKPEMEILKLWSQSGSTIIIEYATKDTNLGELKIVQQQLKEILRDLASSGLIEDRDDFHQELVSIETLISEETNKIVLKSQEIARLLGIGANHQGIIDTNHLMRNSPFLFASFPIVDMQLIDIFNWHNLVLVIGNLTDSWSLEEELVRQREQVRTSQEMGINLLNFAWEWHHLQSLSDHHQ